MTDLWGTSPYEFSPLKVTAPEPPVFTPDATDWLGIRSIERDLLRFIGLVDGPERTELERLHRRLKKWIDQNGE
jgi:hypothetical protein